MSFMKTNRRIRIAWEPEVEWIIPLQVAPARVDPTAKSVELSPDFIAAVASAAAASGGLRPSPDRPQPRLHPPSPGSCYAL